ncbi:MAG: 50S ribosomal protein L17 [Candidatus Levybacteria bacterium RBG_16_35_11]|nr:MAG: 50S ribosomal protein L17 [Candidatus Levybacteria bacterium RBG_16_35_11]
MKKNIFGKQLSRDKNERTALFKGLMSSLVLNESIKTTEAKAKAIKAEIDKLVTKARKEKELAKRLLGKKLTPLAIEKMIDSVAPRFKERKGGYTRIIRLGKRFGDDAQVVMLEWTEKAQIIEPVEVKKKTTKGKKEKEIKRPVRKVNKKTSRLRSSKK